MRLIKYAHACVRLESEHGVLVFDPGCWSEPVALDGADAVLITHEHPDHVEFDRLRAAAQANPGLRVWAPAAVTDQLPELGDRVTAVDAGEAFQAAGFDVRTFGGQHALIHRDIPRIANVGYLVAGVYHPGDSFAVPDADTPVSDLLVPVSGPWLKVGEVIDFVRTVKAERAYPIHELVNSDIGNGLADARIPDLAPDTGYRRLHPGESVEL